MSSSCFAHLTLRNSCEVVYIEDGRLDQKRVTARLFGSKTLEWTNSWTNSLFLTVVRIDWRILQETKTLDLSHFLIHCVFFVFGEWIHRPCNYTCEQKRLYTSFTPWHLTTSIQFNFPPFPTKNTITNHKSAVTSPDTSASQKNMFYNSEIFPAINDRCFNS